MSHTTTIGTVAIRDLDALRSAVDELKQGGVACDLVSNAKPRLYFADQGPMCDLVLRLSSCRFDVGFQKQADGSYSAVTDLHDGLVGEHIGASCPMPNTPQGRAQHAIGKLMQGYSRHATLNQARKQGMSVARCWTDDAGNVQLVLNAA